MIDWTAHALGLATRLERERDDADVVCRRVDDIVATLRALCEITAQVEMVEMVLEAKEAQLAVQREVFASIAYPVLEVRKDVLCVPVVGPIDADRVANLTEVVLEAARGRRARLVVLDLTGAMVADTASALSIAKVFRTLALLGVRGAVSGIDPTLATLLVNQPEELGVPAHLTLADALSASGDEPRKAPIDPEERP